MRQIDDPSALTHGGSLAAMVGSQTFAVALAVDGKPVGWGKLSLQPHSTIKATWEFASIWAAPDKVRASNTFQMVQLGPIIRPDKAGPGEAYLVAVRLNYLPKEKERAGA